ncbi:MAG: phosphatase PAP2 family protein [Bacillota bacterium]|nr:phosphatase PAP2 family protein [Bacillota bacterium]
MIKRVVNRPRPYKTLENAIALKPPSCQYSFPSGHTCAAFTMAFVLANNMPEFGLAFYLLASMVGISRMYLGFHYPTDVLAGFLIAHLSIVLPLIY